VRVGADRDGAGLDVQQPHLHDRGGGVEGELHLPVEAGAGVADLDE